MSFHKAFQMSSNQAEDQNEIQENEDWQDCNQSEESTSAHQDDVQCTLNRTSGSSKELPCKRKASTQDNFVRIYKVRDSVPSFKSKVVPTLLRNNIVDRSYKRTFASLHICKPVGVAVKKPRFDYNSDADNKDSKQFEVSQNTSMTDINDRDDPNVTDDCLTENVNDESAQSVEEMQCVCSSVMISSQTNKNTGIENTEEIKKGNVIRQKEESNIDCGYKSTIKIINTINTTDRTIDQGPPSCFDCLKTNKSVKIKILPQPSTREHFEQNNINHYFTIPVTNTYHSCLGKRTLSSSSIKDKALDKDQVDDSKIKSLIKLIESCYEGVDMKLSLFMTACAHDPRNLQPFPDKVLEDNDMNRHLLYYLAEEIPCVNMILFLLKEKEPVSVRKELIPVVDWLIRSEDPRLVALKHQENKDLLAKISNNPSERFPSKIFRLKSRRNSELEQFWQQVKGDNETIFAYHCCKVEEAHSILHYGLHNHLNKNGVFGPGVYLTDNLDFCVDNCLPGNTWGKSSLGTKVKLVLITEFIFNHSVMSYSGHGLPFQNDKSDCQETANSRYYFLTKPKLIRLRYLMVYVIEPSALPKNPFSYAHVRRKLIKYLGIFRISLLIATIFMGATASQRKVQPTSWFIESVQNYYQKFSSDLLQWPIWKYVETPYIAVPLSDSVPHTCSNMF